jgi:hypothetical protein
VDSAEETFELREFGQVDSTAGNGRSEFKQLKSQHVLVHTPPLREEVGVSRSTLHREGEDEHHNLFQQPKLELFKRLVGKLITWVPPSSASKKSHLAITHGFSDNKYEPAARI